MLTILKFILISYVFSDLALFISDILDIKIIKHSKNRLISLITIIIQYVLGCNKCFSFWLTLICTGDIVIACIVSILVQWLKEIEYRINTKL